MLEYLNEAADAVRFLSKEETTCVHTTESEKRHGKPWGTRKQATMATNGDVGTKTLSKSSAAALVALARHWPSYSLLFLL